MKTREDVIKTIRDLTQDLKHNEDSWENPNLAQYLEAMGAWLEGYGSKYNSQPSWDFIVEMLLAAKIYE